MGGFNSGRNNPPPPKAVPGSRRGVPNKVGAYAKQTIVDVFLGLGGKDAMIAWALKNKTEFYKIYARLIPTDITGSVDVRDATELSDDELNGIVSLAIRRSKGVAGETLGEEVVPPVH